MSEEKNEEVISKNPDLDLTVTHDAEELIDEEEFKEQYQKLPVWKQVILLVLFLGAMTAVIMLINFVVDFSAELIKALLS